MFHWIQSSQRNPLSTITNSRVLDKRVKISINCITLVKIYNYPRDRLKWTSRNLLLHTYLLRKLFASDTSLPWDWLFPNRHNILSQKTFFLNRTNLLAHIRTDSGKMFWFRIIPNMNSDITSQERLRMFKFANPKICQRYFLLFAQVILPQNKLRPSRL